jgi:hypothetical protein
MQKVIVRVETIWRLSMKDLWEHFWIYRLQPKIFKNRFPLFPSITVKLHNRHVPFNLKHDEKFNAINRGKKLEKIFSIIKL